MKFPLIFDGAFGTYYANISGKNENPEFANINDKESVLRIHKEYIESGSNSITTNTFGANYSLCDAQTLKNIITEGCNIAKEAVSDKNINIFADIGRITLEQPSDDYIKIAKIFIENGIKHFLFETLYDTSDIKDAVTFIKDSLPDSTVIVSFAVSPDGYTPTGNFFKDLFKETLLIGADIVGLNCICGPAHMLNLIKSVNTLEYPILIMPNSGYPSIQGGRRVFIDNPDYFSDKILAMYKLGIKGFGGCCGTTPAHIKECCRKVSLYDGVITPNISEETELAGYKSNFDFSKKIIAVEIDPPLNKNIKNFIYNANMLKSVGADYITVADSPLARSRADSIMISSLLRRECGIDVIPHMSCRDRNRIALKGALLAGNIDGLHNILIVTGDPVPHGESDVKSNVFCFNSHTLISYVRSLNKEFFSDNPYTICAALNINCKNFDAELKRAEKKIQNGAEILFTQPILSEKALSNFIEAKKLLSCRIFAGIMPFVSYKNAVFLKNEVSGIEIPDEIIDRIKNCSDDEIMGISIEYCRGFIDRVYDICDGFYLMTCLSKHEYTKKLIEYIRSK